MYGIGTSLSRLSCVKYTEFRYLIMYYVHCFSFVYIYSTKEYDRFLHTNLEIIRFKLDRAHGGFDYCVCFRSTISHSLLVIWSIIATRVDDNGSYSCPMRSSVVICVGRRI